MSELIEFLRHEADVADSDGVPDTARRYREAVDGIERLVEVIDEQRQQNEDTLQEIEWLREENAILRMTYGLEVAKARQRTLTTDTDSVGGSDESMQ